MKPICVFMAMAIAAFTMGCKSTNVSPISMIVASKLDRNASIFITTPHDGNYGPEFYFGSGTSVARAFEAAFIPYTGNVIIGGQTGPMVDALDAARTNSCKYLVFPKITHWEDRATEWSGIPDQIELIVKVVLVENGTDINAVKINGKSSWFTFGGDHPQDLLKEPIEKFVGSLF